MEYQDRKKVAIDIRRGYYGFLEESKDRGRKLDERIQVKPWRIIRGEEKSAITSGAAKFSV